MDIFEWLKDEVRLMAEEELERMRYEYWGDWSKPAKFMGLGSWIKGEKTMDSITRMMIGRRTMELQQAQRTKARWERLQQEVVGSIHAFAIEEDAVFLKHAIESEDTTIRSLEAEIEKLENPPVVEKVLVLPSAIKNHPGMHDQVEMLQEAGFEVQWYN